MYKTEPSAGLHNNSQEVPCPHLHVYREGYGHKWAFPISADRYPDLLNPLNAFHAFMQNCNVTEPPQFQGGLF